jgi:hypothetical protein
MAAHSRSSMERRSRSEERLSFNKPYYYAAECKLAKNNRTFQINLAMRVSLTLKPKSA